jgi:hypothetical protein
MGLDMYLYKRTYVQKWEHQKPENSFDVNVKRGGVTYPNVKPERIVYVIEQVGQWRKFYPLNEWFFDNCGIGNESREFNVDREKLVEVLNLLKEQVGNPDKDMLNGMNENKWHYEQAEETIELLNEILSEDDSDDFYYYASW